MNINKRGSNLFVNKIETMWSVYVKIELTLIVIFKHVLGWLPIPLV